jgi:hypothetical protein
MMLPVLMLSLTASTKAYALDPISIAGVFVSPIFCKMIECKSETTNYMFAEDPEGSKERLAEMRDSFHWNELAEGLYQEGECRDFVSDVSINNSNVGRACYIEGKWEIQPDEEYCFERPFTEGCAVPSIR